MGNVETNNVEKDRETVWIQDMNQIRRSEETFGIFFRYYKTSIAQGISFSRGRRWSGS